MVGLKEVHQVGSLLMVGLKEVHQVGPLLMVSLMAVFQAGQFSWWALWLCVRLATSNGGPLWYSQ